MLFVFLIFRVYANFGSISYGDLTGPLSLEPPVTWHVSQIQLNSNHVGSFHELKLLFNLNHYSGNFSEIYAQITIPSEDSPIKCSLVPILKSADDWAAVCNYSVESSGIYGPVSLTLKFGEKGQILAVSKNFGYFSVIDDEPLSDSGNLKISYLKSDQHVLQSTSLNISFDLGPYDMISPNDYIVVKIDSKFSIDLNDFVVLFGDEEKEHNEIEFKFDQDSKSIIIFGFSELIEGEKSLWIIIHSLINPWYAKDGDDYEWNLKICKYGTPTDLYRYQGSGPSDPILTNNIISVLWNMKHEKIKNKIVYGLIAFTEIVIQAENFIPKNGLFEIKTQSVKFCQKLHSTNSTQYADSKSESKGCSVLAEIEDNIKINCIVEDNDDNSIIKCSPSSYIKPKKEIYISALTQFYSESPQIITIETKDENGNIMNTLKETYTLNMNKVNLLTVNKLYITESWNSLTGINQLGSIGNYGIVFSFNTPEELQVGDSIKVYIPVTKDSSRAEETISLSTDLFYLYKTGTNLDFTATTSMDNAFIGSVDNVVVSSGSITFIMENTALAGDGVIFYVGARSKDNPGPIILPLRPTLLSDFSEAVVVFEKSDFTYIYSKPFFITSNTNDIGFSIKPFCNNVFFEGLPIRIVIIPSFNYQVGQLKAIVSLSANLTEKTGLKAGDVYPTSGTKATLDSDGNLHFNISSLSKDSNVSLTMSYIGFNKDEVVSASLKIYLIDSNEDFLVFSKSSSFKANSSEVTYNYFLTYYKEALHSISQVHQSVYSGDLDNDGTISASVVRFVVVLPPLKKFTFYQSDYLTQVGTDNFNFKYGFGYGTKLLSEDLSYSFYANFYNLWYEYKQNFSSIFAFASGENFDDNYCMQSLKDTYILFNAPSFSFWSFAPNTQDAFTIENQFTNLVLTLNTNLQIKPYCYIVFELGKDWLDLYIEDSSYIKIQDSIITGKYTSKGVWRSEDLTEPKKGLLEVHVKVKLPKITSSDTLKYYIGFESVNVYFNNGDTQSLSIGWNQTTDATAINIITQFNSKPIIPLKSNAIIWAFPDVAGSEYVYVGLSFHAPFLIPKGSIIEIDGGFYDDEKASEHTWINFIHSSVKVSDGTLKITLYEEILKNSKIEIVKDYAFNLEKTGFKKVLVKLLYDDHYFIDDSEEYRDDDQQGFEIKEQPSISITKESFKISKLNAGFDSWYIFDLKFSDKISTSDYIMFDPNKEFDAHPGKTFTFESIPGKYFIEAYLVYDNDNLEFSLCSVEHWLITCNLPENAKKESEIQIMINLKNPQKEAYFSIYLMDSTKLITVNPYYMSKDRGASISDELAESIELVYVIPEYTESYSEILHKIVIYSKLDLMISKNGAFFVDFPKPYDLSLSDLSSMECEAIYIDKVSNDYVKISNKKNCIVDGNSVTLFTDEMDKDLYLVPKSLTIFTISGLITPKEGFSRQNFEYESPLKPSVFYSETFKISYATFEEEENFKVFNVKSISSSNLNAAFANFEKSTKTSIIINNGEDLIGTTGCYVGNYRIELPVFEFLAQEIEITGILRDDVSLILSDGGVYTLRPLSPVAEFRIGVHPDAPAGFYYIDWKIKEINTGVRSNYRVPIPSKVHVNNEIVYQITNEIPLNVPIGFYSSPYPFIIKGGDYYVTPFDSIEITFNKKNDSVDVQFMPDTIVIDDSRNYGALRINCSNCQEDGGPYYFEATVTGPSAKHFNIYNDFKFFYNQNYTLFPVLYLMFDISRTGTYEVYLYSNSLAIFTWAIVGELINDPTKITEDYILNNTQEYGSTSHSIPSFEEKYEEYSHELYELLSESSSYEEFVKIGMEKGRSIFFSKQDIIFGDQTKLIATFPELSPRSNYTFYASFNCFNNLTSIFMVDFLYTYDIKSHAMIEIENIDNYENLTESLATLLNIDIKQVNKRHSPPKRGLSDSEAIFIYSSMTDSYSSYDKVSNYTKKELSSILGVQVNSISKVSVDDYPDADWYINPKWSFENKFNLVFNFSSTTDGNLICEIETSPDTQNYTITTEQVYYGYDRYGNKNSDSDYVLNVSSKVSFIYIFNFANYENNIYVVSCIVCNEYPLTPECSTVKSKEVLKSKDSISSVGLGAFLELAFTILYLVI